MNSLRVSEFIQLGNPTLFWMYSYLESSLALWFWIYGKIGYALPFCAMSWISQNLRKWRQKQVLLFELTEINIEYTRRISCPMLTILFSMYLDTMCHLIFNVWHSWLACRILLISVKKLDWGLVLRLLELQQSSYLVSSIDLLAQVLILVTFNSYLDEAMFTLALDVIKVLKNVQYLLSLCAQIWKAFWMMWSHSCRP